MTGAPHRQFDVIAFDADDTLWRSEDSFHHASSVRRAGRPARAGRVDVYDALRATERADVSITGLRRQGVHAVDGAAAITVTDGTVPAG